MPCEKKLNRKKTEKKEGNARYRSMLDESKKQIYRECDAQYRREKRAREKAQLETAKRANEEEAKKALTKKREAAALRQRKCRERVSCYAIIW